eukprot:TRINITY_DN14558_c0_g1_i1.p1 TRINITY_DN14558_c0_g1~~TRINITY_DN14558_c0_g1_i1.p1  ORF type:complete len:1459 (+),score=441.66 TRINITY_DN14558_c0_g1_i1:31-4407(+)
MAKAWLVFVTLWACTAVSNGKNIRASVTAGWGQTELVHEAAEFVSEMGGEEKFWEFVAGAEESLQEGMTEEDVHQVIMRLGDKTVGMKSLMGFALANRYYSPRVVAQASLCPEATLSVTSLCNQTASTLAELRTVLKSPCSTPYPSTLGHAHGTAPHYLLCAPLAHPDLKEVRSILLSTKASYTLCLNGNYTSSEHNVGLQGYGVSMMIKDMEYKAMDDKQKDEAGGQAEVEEKEEEAADTVLGVKLEGVRKAYPEAAEGIDALEQKLREKEGEDEHTADINLAVWQIQDLGFQAAYKTLKSGSPLQALATISQDFPRHANTLSKISRTNYKRVMKALKNQAEAMRGNPSYPEPGNSALFVNNEMVDISELSAHSLFELLGKMHKKTSHLVDVASWGSAADTNETRAILEALQKINLGSAPARGRRKQEAVPSLRYDFDAEKVSFANDIEKDDMYADWNPRMMGLPNFPRKNIFTSINLIDPIQREGLGLAQMALMLLRQMAPIRMGIVLVDPSVGPDAKASDEQVSVETVDGTQLTVTTRQVIACTFQKMYAQSPQSAFTYLYRLRMSGRGERVTLDEVVALLGGDLQDAVDEQCVAKLKEDSEYVASKGMLSEQASVLFNGLHSENPQATVMFFQTEVEQVAQHMSSFKKERDVYKFLMKEFSAVQKHQPALADKNKAYHLLPPSAMSPLDDLPYLYSPSHETGPVHTTILFAANPAHPVTHDQVGEMLAFLKSEKANGVRVAVLVNPGDHAEKIQRALAGVKGAAEGETLTMFEKCYTEGVCKGDAVVTPVKMLHLTGLEGPENSFSINGRVVKISTKAGADVVPAFTADDWGTAVEQGKELAEEVRTVLAASGSHVATQVYAATSVLMATKSETATIHGLHHVTQQQRRLGFKIPAKLDADAQNPFTLDIIAVLNPLSEEAQKVTPVLQAINSIIPSEISVYLNPLQAMSEVPLRTFYRFVFEPKVKFDAEGAVATPAATFARLPEQQVLTMAVHEPEPWIVTTKEALHDLDNIKLSDVRTNTLTAKYELDYILVSGSCVDTVTGQPPRGLPLVLSHTTEHDTTDTLVMSNLGYFQLKARPGVWNMSIQEGGKADKMHYIEEGGGTVIVNSFDGKTMDVKVGRREGMEDEDLLREDEPENKPKTAKKEEGIYGKISSLLSGGQNEGEVKVPERPTLNIFSVATGHLYERFLKIMIHTTMLHSNGKGARVKFWFLNNFLSPQFKENIHKMAEKWGFEVGLVTYKWPQWLRRQSQKQRIIWGYKVLFLDVLFPLDVDKIIYVDADQIVKSDLHELANLDLAGRAVGYTPFCIQNANEETLGFRFWASGYWKDHLQGSPYHISAIYVVDLKKFRQMAAGDTYRSLYDNLSQDPNSLSNLDQDLPNYAQNIVPIFSLPEHWLWCETWCNQKSKAAAKTIDLCNNPLTKTPKLVNAKRIVPEWVSYDKIIDEFEKSLER